MDKKTLIYRDSYKIHSLIRYTDRFILRIFSVSYTMGSRRAPVTSQAFEHVVSHAFRSASLV